MDRARYAAAPERSLGRLLPEAGSRTRSEFQRDRDRIIHSTAFRRLAHKTQVFVPHEGDHYRTRLTHSIEVGQLARAMSRSLHLDEDLAEAVALAHDLGHTPFGHTGEEVLDELMTGLGGFDHNAQTLRIVTSLERRYADFDGLNLTYEALEGLAKHNGPLLKEDGSPVASYAKRGVPAIFLELNAERDLRLTQFASAEAQAAALADDIAYNAHDLDDGLRAGLFTLAECRAVPFLDDVLDEIAIRHAVLDESRTIHELSRRVITRFVENAIDCACERLASLDSLDSVRCAGRPMLASTAPMLDAERDIKGFLWTHMYRHRDLVTIRERAAEVVRDLFLAFQDAPHLMPEEWAESATSAGRPGRRERLVCDYIAGMTDRYALGEHRRFFPTTPELRYSSQTRRS